MKTESGIDMVECPSIDRDAMEMDPSGWWFLIKPNFRYGYIEVAACHKEGPHPNFLADDEKARKIREIFYGRCAQDIYHMILRQRDYITAPTHAAYLGKELKKAEIALALGIPKFYQE